MSDKPDEPVWPSVAQTRAFMARGVALSNVSSVPVARVPELVVYREGPQPPAPAPDGVKRARTVEEGPEPEQLLPPEPPTEAELRELLHQCNLARDFAHDNELRAKATWERAQRHAARCRERVASFEPLDRQIAEATIEALHDEHRSRIDMPDELRQRLTERDLARDDLRAAENAERVLTEALAETRADAAAAATAARRAAMTVLSLQAEAAAVRHDELLAEAAEFRTMLAQFDRVCTGSGVTMPAVVLNVLRDPKHGMNLNRVMDGGDWVGALDALLLDAQAGVESDDTDVEME